MCLYCVCHHLSVCDRVADKKAAIGYTYEDSSGGAGGGIGVDNIDDDLSSDEDIDLGQSLILSHVLLTICLSFHTAQSSGRSTK